MPYQRPGGGASSILEVVHDPKVLNPIPVLYSVPGSEVSTINAALIVPNIKLLTAGVFTVDGHSTAPVDYSGVADGLPGLNPIVALLNTALKAVPALSGYSASLVFENPTFFFSISNANGAVGALSGNMVTAMSLESFTDTTAYSAKSPQLTLPLSPSGYWSELRFFGLFHAGNASIPGTFKTTYTSDGTNEYCWLSVRSNTGAWWEEVTYSPTDGLFNIGKITAWTLTYSDIKFSPVTGAVTWDNKRNLVPTPGSLYRLHSLFVIGTRSG